MKSAKGLLLLAKPGGDDEDDAPPSSRSGGDVGDGYLSELADMLGVKDSDRKAFGMALRGYVRACRGEADEDEG